MAKLDNVRRILPQEFPEEDQETVTKLANVINYFMTQTFDVINGRLDYENINKQVVTFDVVVDSKGNPVQSLNFTAESGAIGGVVLNARNLTNTSVYPTSQPFVSFNAIQQNKLYKVNNISGLQANNRYRITLEVTY